MGKKKSNVGKQRQAKAKQQQRNIGKPSLLGGVAVTKGFSSKFQQQAKHQQQQLVGTKGNLHHPSSSQKAKTIANNTSNKTPALPSLASSPSSFPNKNNDGTTLTMTISRKELLQRLRNVQPKVFLSPPHHPASSGGNHVATSLQPRVRSRTDHDGDSGGGIERVEFERQMASLQERQWAAANNKSSVSHKKTKRGGTKRGKLSSSVGGATTGNSNAHSPVGGDAAPKSPFAFQPASFSVDKSTQDLLQEAMHQMVHMTGVGISAVEKTPIRSNKTVTEACDGYSFELGQERQFLPTMVSAPSTVSSTASTSAQQQQAYGHNRLLQPPSTKNSNNPFGALEMGDSSDEEGQDEGTCNGWLREPSTTTIKLPTISFAPASFSLMPTQTPTPASTPTAPGHPHNRTMYGEAGMSALRAIRSGGGSSLTLALGTASEPPLHHQQQHASELFGSNLHASSKAENEEDDNVDPDL